MSSDEEFARKLQAEFDEEFSLARQQEESDYEFASTLVAKHEISESGSETDEDVNSSKRKSTTICSPDTDSDKTASESELFSEIQSNNRSSKNSKPKGLNNSANSSVSQAGVSAEKKHHDISDSEEEETGSEFSSHKQNKLEKSTDLPIVEDERKICKFGAECYRKSSLHRKQFQHPEVSLKKENESEIPTKKSKMNAIIQNKGSYQFGFYLTTVTGIPQKFNEENAIGIKDLLSPEMGALTASAQFNYMTDISWLMTQYPPQFRDKPLLIVHGEQRESKKALEREASRYSHVKLSQAKLEILYGTHHTKMMLLLYEDGMRVIIHTANLIHGDWHQKTQGVWVSPKFPKMDQPSSVTGDSVTNFKKDFLEYLRAYNTSPINEWCDIIKQHNFSSAKVFLIGSSPGRHVGERKLAFGHLKLRKVLRENGPIHSSVSVSWPVIGQFSSIGSLGARSDLWLCKEFLASLSCTKNIVLEKGFPKLNLVFPSVENVRLSLEGYPAGASLPYSKEVAKKQPWLKSFMHHWKSNSRGRSRASPHIKTYCRLSPDSNSVAWFLVTSANLSKAAWGALEKNGTQLMIRSYELGVLFMPSYFDVDTTFSVSPSSTNYFPFPYDLPLVPYRDSDEPWVWNAPHVDRPDCNGNIWSPS